MTALQTASILSMVMVLAVQFFCVSLRAVSMALRPAVVVRLALSFLVISPFMDVVQRTVKRLVVEALLYCAAMSGRSSVSRLLSMRVVVTGVQLTR